MSAPFTPDDFKACISDPTASMCENFINTLLKLPVLVYKLVNYLFDSSGNPTKAFKSIGQPTGTYLFSDIVLDEDGSRLLCDGREVAQSAYADLYAAIGAKYGAAGAGNFKLPDWRAKMPVGLNGAGSATFAAAGTLNQGTAFGADQVTLEPAQQGSLQMSSSCDDGDAATGSRVSLETLEVNGQTFGDNGSLGTVGPVTVRLADDASPFNIIPPAMGVYIYINT